MASKLAPLKLTNAHTHTLSLSSSHKLTHSLLHTNTPTYNNNTHTNYLTHTLTLMNKHTKTRTFTWKLTCTYLYVQSYKNQTLLLHKALNIHFSSFQWKFRTIANFPDDFRNCKKAEIVQSFSNPLFPFSICSNFLPFARVNSTKLLFLRFSLLTLSVCSEQKFVFYNCLA